jgi:translocator protein
MRRNSTNTTPTFLSHRDYTTTIFMKNIFSLLCCITICLAVGGLAGYATSSSVTTWYVTLNKPFFNPPNWLFGPVWTVLYCMMGIALWAIWRPTHDILLQRLALALFFVQLTLNFLWSFLFFSLQSPLLALVDIVLLLIFLVPTMLVSQKIAPKTIWLFLPYFAWVCFATLLNASIWLLN